MRSIDLHLPQSWNRCTTDELEAIAAAILNEQQRVDRYHPFDWQRVKLNVVLAVNHIEVMSPAVSVGVSSAGDTECLVRRPSDETPWPVTTGQLLALTEQLSWIDDEKANKTIFQFPYPTLEVSQKSQKSQKQLSTFQPFTLQGPPALLDGYTWREYRLLTDWMGEYMRHTNALAQARGADQRDRQRAAIDTARNEFLAILFKPAPPQPAATVPVGFPAGLPASLFTAFSPVQWQVILFWWSSLMAILAKKFPKVFKSQPVGKHRRPAKADTPWDFYNRVTATIQKYVGGLSAQDVDAQPYGVTLQQLEMMAEEAAEMEKIKNRR